jgi:hypothetical protein
MFKHEPTDTKRMRIWETCRTTFVLKPVSHIHKKYRLCLLRYNVDNIRNYFQLQQ